MTGLDYICNINVLFYFQVPQSESDWREKATDFENKWNFNHCLGALDGKHIAIKPPPNAGSLYYNYKHFHSIVLLAIVDANYRFMYVDIGCYGRMSDGGVYNNSNLSTALAENRLHFPPPELLPGSEFIAPYVIVADDAFALKPYMLKPYGQRNLTPDKRIFNYRLSRARRVVESAFGIMSQRFGVFGKPIALEPEKVKVIVHTACCLHNFLSTNSTASSYMSVTDDGSTAAAMSTIVHTGNRHSTDAGNIRDNYCKYFNSAAGSVNWQNDRCNEL